MLRQFVAMAPRGSCVAPRPFSTSYMPKMCHGRAVQQVCLVAKPSANSSDDLVPGWAKEILVLLGSVHKELGSVHKELGSVQKELGSVQKELGSVQKELGSVQKELGSVQKESRTTREMLGVVLEVAVHDTYARLGVKGVGAVLQSMDDVLQLVLPRHILLKVVKDEMYNSIKAAILASLLNKDTGFLKAVILLLEGEGMEKEAEQVEAVLRSGEGIQVVRHNGEGPEVQPAHIVRQCLEAAQARVKAKGLLADIHQLFKYCNAASEQKRMELLQETLFVRCVVAMLLGAYQGVLEIDVGVGEGCEVDEGARALRLRIGETKFSAGELGTANEQLKAVFQVAAFTLDKVLKAAAEAPAASKAAAALKQLPRNFIMDGYCVYAGTATKQQQQRWSTAADRRTEADFSGGFLESAVLQVRFVSARYTTL